MGKLPVKNSLDESSELKKLTTQDQLKGSSKSRQNTDPVPATNGTGTVAPTPAAGPPLDKAPTDDKSINKSSQLDSHDEEECIGKHRHSKRNRRVRRRKNARNLRKNRGNLSDDKILKASHIKSDTQEFSRHKSLGRKIYVN